MRQTAGPDSFRGLVRRVLAPLALSTLLAAAMTVPVHAQDTTAAPATPDAAARAFFAALKDRRWLEAARLVHPAVLARYHEESVATMRSALQEPQRPPVTADELLRHEPQMPREVAEYQARRLAEGSREHNGWLLERAGVASLAELEGLSAEDAFARSLAAHDRRHAMKRAISEQADSTMAELLARALPTPVHTVLGAVSAEGASGDRAYVVYTVAQHGPLSTLRGPEQTGTIGARRHAAGWGVDPGAFAVDGLLGGGNFSIHVNAEGSPRELADAVRRPAVWPAEGAPRLRVRMEGAGDDPLREPPGTLVLERLAPDGAVLVRVEVPAEAWAQLSEVVTMWSLLVQEPVEPGA